MTDLFAARSMMAMALAFHIVFACVGMGMPILMVMAEGLWLRTGNPVYLDLAKRWSKGTAVLFAVGAVTGTVLSFELGLLWPGFMEYAGSIIGMPFSLEGFAFFLEAIFLGITLYGWDRVGRRFHLFSGMMVALSGTMSAVFVVTANAWMNCPTGFLMSGDRVVTDIEPIGAMLNPAAFTEVLHVVLSAFVAVGFAVAGVHAWVLLKRGDSEFHRRAFGLALGLGAVFALLTPLSGDLSAKHVAAWQPVKLAALEGQFETERGAPLRLGGWPDEARGETRWSIDLPKGLSFLAYGDFDAEVKGLHAFPEEDRPPVAVVHLAFQLMVACGSALALFGLTFLFLLVRRRRVPLQRGLLRAAVLCAPLGFVAIEAGWTVTEVGRQPWVVVGFLRTAEAVTPMPHLQLPFAMFAALFLFLGVMVVVLLKRMVFASPGAEPTDPEPEREVQP